MKLALADFTDAVASRVLTGLITSLDMSDNTATVRFDDTSAILVTTVYPSTITITLGQNILTAALSKSDNSASYLLGVDFSVSSTGVTILPGGTLATTIPMAGMEIKINYTAENTITGIPIHYRCHHGADNHGASRVFKIGDEPLILYRGKGALPSAGNLTLLGLKDEIRRCRLMSGILFDLAGSPALVNSVSSDEKVEYPSVAVAGARNWFGFGMIISTESSGWRYAHDAGGSDIYIDGEIWDSAPFDVRGAAAMGTETIVATDGIWVYTRPKNKATEWFKLSGTIAEPVPVGIPVFFSPDGRKAVAANYGTVYYFEINTESYTLTKANEETFEWVVAPVVVFDNYSTYESRAFYPRYYDFDLNGVLLKCGVETHRTATYQVDLGEPYRDYTSLRPIKKTYTVITKQNLTVNGAIIFSTEDKYIGVINDTSASFTQEKQSVSNGIFPVKPDIRYDVKDKYEQSITANSSVSSNRYYIFNDDTRTVTEVAATQITGTSTAHAHFLKKMGDDILSTRDLYSTIENYTFMDAGGAYTGAWPVIPSSDTWYMLLSQPLLVNYLMTLTDPAMSDKIDSAKHPVTNDKLQVWKHEPALPAYIRFNGANGIPLLKGDGTPLVPFDSATLVPADLKLV